MIGIVILGHADYPSGLKSAIELLVGNPENFEALGLYQGESPDDYKSKISLLIDQVDDGDGVLVLVRGFSLLSACNARNTKPPAMRVENTFCFAN